MRTTEDHEAEHLLRSSDVDIERSWLSNGDEAEKSQSPYLSNHAWRFFAGRPATSAKRLLRVVIYAPVFTALLVLLCSAYLAIMCPIYDDPPERYRALDEMSASSREAGRVNVNQERVFIAANIIDADLINGPWGQSLLDLVDLLGPEHTFVSIYENDSGVETVDALRALRERLPCNKSVVTGAHLDTTAMPTVELPAGDAGVKRTEYLSHVRNLALRPLDRFPKASDIQHDGFRSTQGTFDRVLFLNDIFFDPLDAAKLLFATRATEGQTQYQAACAVDFVSTANFYDSYATRDYDGSGLGYGPGFRVFPWFSSRGSGVSRRATLQGLDGVPVRSCWGGMVAFNARYFQQDGLAEPLRFRSVNEAYWDSSECCLIHADLSSRYLAGEKDPSDYGIYINPYVRVAYDRKTFERLPVMRRFEHGFSVVQGILSWLWRYPTVSERALENPGQQADHLEWTWGEPGHGSDNMAKGEFIQKNLIAGSGGFCGMREMAVMKADWARALEMGERPFNVYFSPNGLWRKL